MVKEPKMIRIQEGESETEVPLLDVEEALQLHHKRYPIAIMVAGRRQALVFKIIAKSDQEEINSRYKDWLTNYFYDAFADVQRIAEKKLADRTTEETDKVIEFQRESYPYLTEICHAMLDEPAMELGTFREIMDEAGLEEWTKISQHCRGILEPLVKDPKNS